MKVLILGCNGMAGHLVSLYLDERGHEVLGYARKPSRLIKSIVGDVTNFETLKNVVISGKFDAVINCVGVLNQFAEEKKDNAILVNSYLPHFLSSITADLDTQIIHISTDCVFSGNKGNYTENDLRDGCSFYDRSKALGELEDNKNLTLRQSIIGPDINPSGIGLLNWFMQQSDAVNGFLGAIWTGQTTYQLAKTIDFFLTEKYCGLINMVPRDSISKFDLLMLFNKYIRNNSVVVNPVIGVKVDKSLVRTKNDINYEIPDYEEMVFELSVWMKTHDYLYPHYCM